MLPRAIAVRCSVGLSGILACRGQSRVAVVGLTEGFFLHYLVRFRACVSRDKRVEAKH